MRDVEEGRAEEKHKELAEGVSYGDWQLSRQLYSRLAHLVGVTFLGYFPRKLLVF